MTVKIANAYTAADPTISTEIIGSPFTVTVDSDPRKSSIETFKKTHILVEDYRMTIQSRDAKNKKIDSKNDLYSVEFTRIDGSVFEY